MEAAQVWNVCVQAHRRARMSHAHWPNQTDLQQLTRGRFALHSQSVQAVFRSFHCTSAWQSRKRTPLPAACKPSSISEKSTWLPPPRARAWRSSSPDAAFARSSASATDSSGSLPKSRAAARSIRVGGRNCNAPETRCAAGLSDACATLSHKATRAVIDFCVESPVGTLFVGNPHGVRTRDCGRHHNQRMSGWEYGRDSDYLAHKSTQARI